MTRTQRHLSRALMVGALAVGAWAATEAAHDDTAQAADQKPGVALPAQASDRAKQVHALLADATPEPPAEPQLEQEPADPPPTEPDADPVVEVSPVVVENPPVAELLPPVVVEPAPTEPARTVTPAVTPAPKIPALDALLDPQGTPLRAPVIKVPPKPELAPATQPDPLPWNVNTAPPEQASEGPADCDNPPDDATHVDRDVIRQLIDNLTAPASRTDNRQRCSDHPPHPASPDAVGQQQPTGKPPADVATGIPTHALNRLEHARARSQLPGSRHVAVEPGPA